MECNVCCCVGVSMCNSRNIWSFFRLENEHLNNCGQYRAVKEVPVLVKEEPAAIKVKDAWVPKVVCYVAHYSITPFFIILITWFSTSVLRRVSAVHPSISHHITSHDTYATLVSYCVQCPHVLKSS
jgi:hypothetical protein